MRRAALLSTSATPRATLGYSPLLHPRRSPPLSATLGYSLAVEVRPAQVALVEPRVYQDQAVEEVV